MEPITLSISSRYAQNWTRIEALRELIANGIDRETEGAGREGKFSLYHRGATLKLVNADTVLTADKLVLGQSSNRDNDLAIGQFGEGLKLALMVLSRLGHAVTIDTGWERWTPVLEASDTFNGAEVLKIKRRKLREERFDLEITVDGIDIEEYREVRQLFLRLNEFFDENMTVRGSPYSNEKVLLQEGFRGRIYVKGVFVSLRQDSNFGYDLNVDLNRDRSIIDEWRLKDEISQLLSAACNYNPEKFAEQLFPVLFTDDSSLETVDEYSNLKYNTPFQKLIVDEWDRRYGADVLPIKAGEMDTLNRLGLRGVVVSNLVRTVIGKVYGEVSTRLKEAENRVVEVIDPRDLTGEERANWEAALKIGQAVCPQLQHWKMAICTFPSNGVLYHDDNDVHYINRICLSDRVSAIKAVARQVSVLSDASSSESAMNHILATMVVKQAELNLQNSNVVDLATLRRLILEAS